MTRLDCELCGRQPREGLVLLRPDREVCRPCRELVITGWLMIQKHGQEHVRDLLYQMFDEHWKANAD